MFLMPATALVETKIVETTLVENPVVENPLAETELEPWFSFEMPYAYWITYDGPLKNSPYQFPNSEMTLDNSYSDELQMALNFTLTADTTEQEADANSNFTEWP
jgi:hypothetical protein